MMEQHYLELGMRMRLRRRELHLTQKELAALCHVSANHISAVESAKEKPSLDMLILLCDALRTTPDFLLLEASMPKPIPCPILRTSFAYAPRRTLLLPANLLNCLLPATAKRGTGKLHLTQIFLQPG